MSEPHCTSCYRRIEDEAGLRILGDMENMNLPWQDVLLRESISPDDFANWLSQADERKARFTAIRNRNLGGQQ